METVSFVNLKRLKEEILAKIPEAQTYCKGRKVLIAFKENVGPTLSTACEVIDAKILAKVAIILSKQLLKQNNCWKLL